MFDSRSEWLARAHMQMQRCVALRHHIDELEARYSALLADTIDAYAWPKEIPVPVGQDAYRPCRVRDRSFGEDLISELAVLHKTSETSAEMLAGDVVDLVGHLPRCFAQVTSA